MSGFSMPECPHCKHKFNDDQVWYSADGCNFPIEHGDMSDNEFDCPACFAHLFVHVEWTPSWTFTDEDGDELDISGDSK